MRNSIVSNGDYFNDKKKFCVAWKFVFLILHKYIFCCCQDSTAEYISGKESTSENGIYESGLQCVTVLIGAYDFNSGMPVIGIVNQPFHHLSDSK